VEIEMDGVDEAPERQEAVCPDEFVKNLPKMYPNPFLVKMNA
jgi:hypothetical protein